MPSLQSKSYQRIAIAGCSGSGKSTLAKMLADKTNLPVTHLDRLFWTPGWIQQDSDVFKEKHQEVINEDSWIIEGNNSSTMPERFKRAELIIIFDYPRLLCFYRLFKRLRNDNGQNRPDMAEGCYERFNMPFYRYVWGFHKTTYPAIMNSIKDSQAEIKILHTQKDAEDLLSQFK